MKDLRDALLKHNMLLKQQQRKLSEYVAELVEVNYDTKGLYKEPLKDINDQIQIALEIFDAMIDKNNKIIEGQDYPYLRFKKEYKEN